MPLSRVIAAAAVAAAALATAVTTPVGAQAPAGQPAAVAAGKRVALNICATCHVVAADQPFAPVLRHPAPRFAAIANRPSTTEASLRTYIATAHATIQNPSGMPDPQLTDEQLGDVVVYLMSLRRPR